MGQNNDPPSYNILNESVNIWARNQRHLIPITKKDDYHNAIVSNTSTHPNLMIDNQHEKPTLENVYRKEFECIVKKPNNILMKCDSGLLINKPKHYFNEMWDDLFDKSTYWRYVIWYDFNNFCVLETIVLRMIAGLKKKKKKDEIK